MKQPVFTAKCLEDPRQLTSEQLEQSLNWLCSLTPPLQYILHAELKAGNKVTAISHDYPDTSSLCATLAKRFTKRYRQTGLLYCRTNDPHYWYAEYCTKEIPRQLLVCSW